MAFPEEVQQALDQDQVIDITTIGRKSGKSSRIETWFHRIGDRYYLTGSPGKRDWYANLAANPDFTFHLKRSAQADLPAVASAITDAAEKRMVLGQVLTSIGRPSSELEAWISGAPLVEVIFAAG